MWKEFKQFAFKGNVVDMAVGVMIGGAFGKIVTSIVNDIFMPVFSLLTGKVDISGLFVALDGGEYATLADAQAANAATLNYGMFLANVLDFLMIAICVFFFVKLLNKLHRHKEEAPAPAEEPRLCPYCRTEIAKEATRCPHCTSQLED